ncbi:hypothetical protein [Nitrosomonas marina]|uniref:Uncharacterized protein n=1 Tax=Nitrosomonas marina TaxID=917 RepID=A0A1H8G064_9PROT|nr:hypothetical protein [Nitrosomonas marina]SEN37376.1 hypothetical protein SAMN05216325_11576 [Nitrosomonas marina]
MKDIELFFKIREESTHTRNCSKSTQSAADLLNRIEGAAYSNAEA